MENPKKWDENLQFSEEPSHPHYTNITEQSADFGDTQNCIVSIDPVTLRKADLTAFHNKLKQR